MTVRVTDNGSPALSDSETISITVNEVNVAPVLAAIGNKTVDEGSLLTFTATATDADLPANSADLTAWTRRAGRSGDQRARRASSPGRRPRAQGPGSYSVTVRVTDNGSPALTDSETISITVERSQRRAGAGRDRQQDGRRRQPADLHGDGDRRRPAGQQPDLQPGRGRAGRSRDRRRDAASFTWTPTESAGPGHVQRDGAGDRQRLAGAERLRDDQRSRSTKSTWRRCWPRSATRRSTKAAC